MCFLKLLWSVLHITQHLRHLLREFHVETSMLKFPCTLPRQHLNFREYLWGFHGATSIVVLLKTQKLWSNTRRTIGIWVKPGEVFSQDKTYHFVLYFWLGKLDLWCSRFLLQCSSYEKNGIFFFVYQVILGLPNHFPYKGMVHPVTSMRRCIQACHLTM